MRTGPWTTLGLLAIFCLHPAAAGDRPAPDPQLGAIAVRVLAKMGGMGAVGVRSHATEVYLVKVEEGVDVLRATDIIVSNLDAKEQAYLLNAEPGKYVAIGAYVTTGFQDDVSSRIYFNQEMVPKTEVTVVPGRIAFVGDIEVKMAPGMKEADGTQDHYADLIGRGIGLHYTARLHVGTGQPREGGVSDIIKHFTRAAELKNLNRDAKAANAFWTIAVRKTFHGDSDWQALAQRELDSLK